MWYKDETRCRSCGSESLTEVIEFGETPLADRLLTPEQLDDDKLFVPLTVVFCEDCALVQIRETVDPEILFYAEYPYFSSVSKSLMDHFGNSALSIIEKRGLDENSFVLEVASNDGYMLRNFHERGVPVLGIEPTDGPAQAASDLGIPTRQLFFTRDLATELRKEFPEGADVFLANNVLAHVPDLNGFVAGIGAVLNDSGVAVIEVPYLVDLVDHCEFDTMYHQHLCYFSVSALDRLFRRHGLFLNHVERTPIHGGSLRLFVEPKEDVDETVTDLLAMEKERRVTDLSFYSDFSARVESVKNSLMSILTDLKRNGKSIAGYGAAAKANTLMAYIGVDHTLLDFVSDKNEFKQGKLYSGMHIPIESPESLRTKKPDYVLILAWNFAEEIMQEQSRYAESGGRFIIPIPEPRIV